MADSANHLRTSAPPKVAVACLAEYLQWEAAETTFTEFKPAKPNERVYFIGSDDGPVKIGVTINPTQRLESLQTGSPAPLRLLALVSGGRSLERAYHRYFDRFRLHGEWFERCCDLEIEIKYWSAKRRDQRRAHWRLA